MKSFYYARSQTLDNEISLIEEIRKAILLKPLSPNDKARLRWETLVKRIHFSFLLTNKEIPIDTIAKLFSTGGKPQPSPLNNQVYRYKNALDYLFQHWLVNSELVTAKNLVDLYKIAFDGRLTATNTELEEALRYIQVNKEHPVIQAALAKIVIYSIEPFSKDNELFSQLVFLLFLYKNAYDFRRLVCFEEYFFNDFANYKKTMAQAVEKENLTEWIEYIAHAIFSQGEKTLKEIDKEKRETTIGKNYFLLNERQKAILSLFDNPNNKISKMMVMRRFKISPVTASRDLTKLKNLGFLLSIGKGRSTYYIRL